MHNSNSQPGKLDGILYRTGCVLSQKDPHPDEQDVSTNVTTASSSSWPGEAPTQAHISGGFPVVRFKCPILLESKIYIQNISFIKEYYWIEVEMNQIQRFQKPYQLFRFGLFYETYIYVPQLMQIVSFHLTRS